MRAANSGGVLMILAGLSSFGGYDYMPPKVRWFEDRSVFRLREAIRSFRALGDRSFRVLGDRSRSATVVAAHESGYRLALPFLNCLERVCVKKAS